MKTIWTANLTSEPERQEFKKAYEYYRQSAIGKRFIEILEQQLEDLNRKADKPSNYESASWPYLQADVVGCKRTIRQLLELFNE